MASGSAGPPTPAGGPDLEALAASARSGDREAFETLVRLTLADTYALARRLTGSDHDAQDVVQETYLRAYRGIRRFRGEAQFRTWLYRITANCSATATARRGRHDHDELTADATSSLADRRADHDPAGRADAAALRADLDAAVADLPPRLRQVVVLRDLYDLPHAAIAEELGITEAAAKVRLHRARRLLRNRLFGAKGERRAG